MGTGTKRLTYADLEKMPADGFRHEIIEGEEFMTPAPEVRHQEVLFKLARILADFMERNDWGKVFVAPIDVVFSDEDVVEPDIVLVSKARLGIVQAKNIQGFPDLLIEVLSPSTASVDRTGKKDLYQRRRVPEYWIIDPQAGMAEVHEFGSPRRTRIYRDDQSFESSLLPGLTLRLSEVFRTS